MNKPKEKQNLQIVLKQIDAFNARDIEGCLKYWTDDLKVIDMPDEKVIFSNKEEVRLHLRKEFSGDMIPSITVLKTKIDGSYVYLLEEKKRSNDSGSKAEFTYHIKDGLIITMWCGPIL